MLGCESRAAVRASRRKRSRTRSSSARWSGRDLIATRRSSFRSRARKTTPIPPRPSSRSSTYWLLRTPSRSSSSRDRAGMKPMYVEVVEVVEERQRRSLDPLDDLDILDYLAFFRRVAAPFLAARLRSARVMLPRLVSGFPRPEPPGLFPPPVCLLTVAHARRSASFSLTPCFS